MRGFKTIKKFAQLSLLVLPALIMAVSAPVSAAVTNPTPSAKVTFTFDDGLASVYSQARPVLAQYGLTGTSYATTNCIGMTTAPNACSADNSKPYMSWAQLTELQDTYGWEIGSHTASHPQLATDGLTRAQVANELTASKAALAAHGINATVFATPYGDYDNTALQEIAKVYESHRGFWDIDNNVWPENDLLINNMQVQEGVTVAQVKAKIDAAITSKNWLVLTFHDITPTPATGTDEYDYTPTELAEIAAYVKAKQDSGLIKQTSHHNGLVTGDTNLVTNGGFATGVADGWTTDDAAVFKADAANNGSFPESTKAVSITAGAASKHLFSPKVAVDSNQTYMLKSFLNLTARTTGEMGYYIDEYDAGGNWISGKWVSSKATPTVQSVNFTYTPSSANVKKASLQVYVDGNSGIKAYIDQFQWFSLNPPATPPATTNNLLTNSTFDAGISGGWTTDNAAVFTADSANNGSTTDPAKSVKLTSGAAAHLFAPKVDVKDTSTYNVEAFLNVATMTSGEVAFYIDEYDANGAWVSGQYAYAQRNVGSSTVTFPYTPSSANVKKAGLQTIVTANSGITGYLDTVQFLAPAGETTTPPVTPTNLMTNSGFDSGMTGWTTDDATNIKADTANHGSTASAVNSVSMTATTANKHLFSPKVTVANTKSYSLASYLNITQRTSGVVGFYVDEYDASGNWISGQYKAEVSAVSAGDTGFQYAPSSVNVKQASLQVIVSGNSSIQAYFDDVRWYQN